MVNEEHRKLLIPDVLVKIFGVMSQVEAQVWVDPCSALLEIDGDGRPLTNRQAGPAHANGSLQVFTLSRLKNKQKQSGDTEIRADSPPAVA